MLITKKDLYKETRVIFRIICEIIFKYNKAVVSTNNWKKILKGSKYFIFNFPKNETIVKPISKYALDDFLQSKLVNTHKNPENILKDWEEDI